MALLGAVVGGPERGGRQRSIGGRSVAEVRRLGEGGFASVWLVQDTATSESFALKKISCPDRKSFEKGLREAELLEWLPRHPNVVGFSGSGVCDGPSAQVKEVLLLLELCSGGHLLDLLESHSGRLTEEQVLGPFSDVAAGVAFLHGRSPPVQHRDLKVENVLLGADGRWKLCDFGSWSSDHIDPGALDKRGLADLEEEIERHTTLMYRPPEMVNFFKQFAISTQVDIWMLGCILFTLMFYRNPFQGESPLAITNARFEFPPPEAGRQPFSERLHDLVRWLLAQDPAHRPSAAELQRLLARFADERGEPLPLPRAVLERKEQHLRLYNPQACPAPAARPSHFENGTALHTRAGTAYYVAPQVLAGRYDRMCDLWSAGVIMYTILCGYPPFYGDSDEQVLACVRQGNYTFEPEDDWRTISRDAKDLVRNLIKMNPAATVAAAARQALGHPWLKSRAPGGGRGSFSFRDAAR
ncbi:unnamed protein product [Prorocentrum cordatum]|uniref:non-specific serine/threonine protein kinase n=1 Tax=Prorocentrum cordatum TaxID=2364126 RepID=A0ABN9YD38_9DINO|nr:unnamed protein product [Polarella glacialis]